MRRTLLYALLAIVTSVSLRAQDTKSALANLGDMNHHGRLSELVQAANSLLANTQLSPADQGAALIYLGSAYQQLGEFTQATATYEKALAVYDRDGHHPSDYAIALGSLATVYSELGQIDTAKHVMLRSVHLFQEQSDHMGAALVLNDLAAMAAEHNSLGEARKYMKQAIAESQLVKGPDPLMLAALTTTHGRIAELDGDPHTAISDYEHALDLWNQTHQDQKTAWLYVLLGSAYLQAGDIAHARETTTRGLAMLEATSGPQTPAYFLAQFAYSKVLDASGDHKEASTLRQKAQAAINTTTDRQRAQSQISVAALR
jgi:tetratricopeptide (TPR) repeat protein